MIVIRGRELTQLINRVLEIVGKEGQAIFFIADSDKGTLEVSAHNDLYMVRKTIPASVSTSVRFALNGEIASRAFIHPDELTLSFKRNVLKFTAAKAAISGELYSLEFEEVRKLKRKSTHKIQKEVGEVLFRKLRQAALKPVYEENKSASLTAMVRTDKKSLHVAVADEYHIALLRDKYTMDTPLNFDFPIGYLSQIEKLVGPKGEFDLYQDVNCLYVLTSDLELSLPLIGTTPVSYDEIIEGVKTFDNPTSSCKVDGGELRKACKAISAMYDKNAADSVVFTVEVGKSELTLQLKSKHGALKEKLKVNTGVSNKKHIVLDWLSVLDVLDKIKDEIEVKIFGEDAARIDYKDGSMVVSYFILGKVEEEPS